MAKALLSIAFSSISGSIGGITYRNTRNGIILSTKNLSNCKKVAANKDLHLAYSLWQAWKHDNYSQHYDYFKAFLQSFIFGSQKRPYSVNKLPGYLYSCVFYSLAAYRQAPSNFTQIFPNFSNFSPAIVNNPANELRCWYTSNPLFTSLKSAMYFSKACTSQSEALNAPLHFFYWPSYNSQLWSTQYNFVLSLGNYAPITGRWIKVGFVPVDTATVNYGALKVVVLQIT
jgi:hypothetical protein